MDGGNSVSDPDRAYVQRLAAGVHSGVGRAGRGDAGRCDQQQQTVGRVGKHVSGPFHVADAPELPIGADICLDQKGEPMLVRGRIPDTEGRPVAATR